MIGEEQGHTAQDLYEGGKLYNNPSSKLRPKTNFSPQELASIRVRQEGAVKVSQSYRTLYYGLKKNHVHSASTAHPLFFVLRRILYSLVIVFMVGEVKPFFGALILTLTSFMMLSFVALEAQWESNMHNKQHLLNEFTFYVVCIGFICFSGVIMETDQSVLLGWLLIGIIIFMITYNTLMILYDLCIFARLLIKRNLNRRKYKKEVKKSKEDLKLNQGRQNQTNKVTPAPQNYLNSEADNMIEDKSESMVEWKDDIKSSNIPLAAMKKDKKAMHIGGVDLLKSEPAVANSKDEPAAESQQRSNALSKKEAKEGQIIEELDDLYDDKNSSPPRIRGVGDDYAH